MYTDAIMSLSYATALQGWFEGWGNVSAAGVCDLNEGSYNCEVDNCKATLLALGGRMFSVWPYISSPTILNIYSKTFSNPVYFGVGLALVNVVPLAFYNSDDNKLSEQVGRIMGYAMMILNLMTIRTLINMTPTPLGNAEFAALTLCAAGCAVSVAFTTLGFFKTNKPEA